MQIVGGAAATESDAPAGMPMGAKSVGPATTASRSRPRPDQCLVSGVFCDAIATHLPPRFWNTSIHE